MNNGQRMPASLESSLLALPEARSQPQLLLSGPVADFDRRVSLRFANVRRFLTEYSSKISVTGMFLRSEDPRLPGTVLELELTLLDGLKLIRGTGEVVWSRKTDLASEQPAGMGVRFLRLDPTSRRLVYWVVEKHLVGGAEPFDLDDSDPRQPHP